jgi:hypothetical protein
MRFRLRLGLFLLFATTLVPLTADDILFIGNSFTFGGAIPVLSHHGGVPALVQEIARARGRQVTARAMTAPGVDWSYHLAQPATSTTLNLRVWTWVVLQDFSTRPTRIGDVRKFIQDGETLSEKIALKSSNAGIVLYETWARPPGSFYQTAPGDAFSGPAQMMADLHQSYAHLRDDLSARNGNRPVRVAPVGTAFARCQAEYPVILLDAADRHHASAEGYYLAALVIYETLYQDHVSSAPTSFFHGAMVIPPVEAMKLQRIADKTCALL